MMYRAKSAVRRWLYGPPPTMGFDDWLDVEKVKANAHYPWFMEEWRAMAMEYARAYVDAITDKTRKKSPPDVSWIEFNK